MMTRLFVHLQSLRSDESGQGLVEYALIISLVSITVITALGLLSGALDGVFTDISNTLTGGGS
jgi:pilus assembly protein Flp/PilA